MIIVTQNAQKLPALRITLCRHQNLEIMNPLHIAVLDYR